MQGAGRKWGDGSRRPPDRGGPTQARLIARAYDLVGALTATLGTLAALGVDLAPDASIDAALPSAALSTRAAAERLGVAPYTLNEWARSGRIPSRQDAPGGPRHYRAADLEAYEARRTGVAIGIGQRYTPGHDDTRRGKGAAPPARADTSRASDGARRSGYDRIAMGARRSSNRPPSGASPCAPSSNAWAKARPWGDPDPEPEG